MSCWVLLPPAKTMLDLRWEDLSLCLVLKSGGVLSTNKLTQEKYLQNLVKSFCAGGKNHLILSYPPHTRFRNSWLVRTDRSNFTPLKASVGDDPALLPSSGWQIANRCNFEEDPSVTCTPPAASPPCSVTLRLSGLVKDFQGKCEGEYKDTGLRSLVRQVIFNSIKSFAHFKQLIGVQTGGLR